MRVQLTSGTPAHKAAVARIETEDARLRVETTATVREEGRAAGRRPASSSS